MLVLVADKDPYDLETARSALRAPDLDVITASDGQEVIKAVTEQLPDVVVVGASLGQMGGFAVSRDLKTMARAGEIPEPKVLVLLERQADDWLAQWSQCDAYRTKPIDGDELELLVRKLVLPREPQAV